MKKWVFVLYAAFLFSIPTVGLAQESDNDKLQFAKTLRERRMADLALEYLSELRKTASPALAQRIPLELARARVDVALEQDPAKRLPLLTEARKELQGLSKNFKNEAATAQIQLELAKIVTYQGQALLGQAYQQTDPNLRSDLADKARTAFLEAKKELDQAEEALTKAESSLPSTSPFKALLQEGIGDAQFSRAKNYIDLSSTYLNATKIADLKAQADARQEAIKALSGILGNRDLPPRFRLLGYAWRIRAYQLTQQQAKAHEDFVRLMDPQFNLAAAQEARRLARYFHILNIYDNPQADPAEYKKKDKVELVEFLCKSWLRDYRDFHNTDAGHGVKFQLGDAYLKQAQRISPDVDNPQAKKYYSQAEKLFSLIAESDSRLAEQARKYSLGIKVQSLGKLPVTKLTSFEDCFVKAQYEMLKLRDVIEKFADAPPQEKEKLLRERETHLNTIITAFNRGLRLVNFQTPPQKIADARFYMAYTYFISGDPYRSAILGEYLARQDPPSKQSASGANYAIQSYAKILEKANFPANRRRLRELAEFILDKRATEWQAEPVIPIAQYQLAMIHLREKEQEKAIAILEKLPKDFGAYTFAQSQLAITALALAKDTADQETQKKLRKKALDALKRIPSLPKDTDPATAQMFILAQMERAKLMYSEAGELIKIDAKAAGKKYEDMANFTQDLQKQFNAAKQSISDNNAREAIGNALNSLGSYGVLGQANMLYRVGDYDSVLQITNPIVSKIREKAKEKAKESILVPDYTVMGAIVGLSMRANVQKGQLKPAEELLDILPRLTDGTLTADPKVALQSLIGELQQQVTELRGKDEKKLEQTIKNFSAFLNALAKQPNLAFNDIYFLATCYSSLEQHEDAAKMYEMIKQPDMTPKENLPKEEKEKHDQEVSRWWFVQSLYASELRQAGNTKKAKEILKPVLDNPKASGRLRAQKEWCLTLMDEGSNRDALQQWSQLIGNPSLRKQVADNPKLKEFYFDCWYHFIDTWYRYSQQKEDPTVKGTDYEQKFLEKAANYIVQLENGMDRTGWELIEPRIRRLLSDTPLLNRAYEKLKTPRK